MGAGGGAFWCFGFLFQAVGDMSYEYLMSFEIIHKPLLLPLLCISVPLVIYHVFCNIVIVFVDPPI